MNDRKPKPVSPKVSRVIIYDPRNRRTMDLDPVNGGILPIVELDQSMINRGSSFSVSLEVTFNTIQPRYFLIQTPNNPTKIFLSGEISSTRPTTINLYEGATVTATGTPIKTVNNDRNSGEQSKAKIFRNPTFTDKGEKILLKYIREEGQHKNKRILKHDTNYLIEIMPSRRNMRVFPLLSWFEAPNPV